MGDKNDGKQISTDPKPWLPLLLPFAAVLLTPREHAGKVAVTALLLTVLFGLLVMNLRHLKIQSGTRPAKLLAGLALAMPIVSVGGCIKYSFLNETASREFLLFNGAGQPMDIVFDGESLRLESRQAMRRKCFSAELQLTDPRSGTVEKISFPEGLSIVAYGKTYAVKVTEVAYEPLSFSDEKKGSGSLASSRIVGNEIFSMKGDFWLYMPGEDVPNTISRPKQSNLRYLSLSVASQ